MRIRTLAVMLAAPREAVFNFLANIENLPCWASGFCERLYLERGRWRALTSQGELFVELAADDTAGVIDVKLGPTLDEFAVMPLRVVPLGEQSTLVTVAFGVAREGADGLARRDEREVQAEFAGLIRRFGGGTLHGIDRAAELVESGRN